MKPGIRAKFIGILILATLLPLAIAAIAVHLLGHKYYQTSAGRVFQYRAQQMANYLVLSVNGYAENLHDWLALSDLHKRLQAHNNLQREIFPEDLQSRMAELEREWDALDEDHPGVQQFLQNDIAADLQDLADISPLFAEILVTDEIGQLVAATDKTSRFWHGDEEWWELGMNQPFRSAHVEGVNFNENAGVYSFDLVIPIRNWREPTAPPVGVAKAVINASPLFFELARNFSIEDAGWKIVLDDGNVLFAHDFHPLEEQIAADAIEALHRSKAGWMISSLNADGRQMAGFARLPWESSLNLDRTSHTSFYVLVHQSAAEVLAPVREQMMMITASGILLILLCFLVGIYLAQHHIIRPINLLQRAAQDIAASAKLEEGRKAGVEVTLEPTTRRLLDRIVRIQSEDEIGALARDFNSMADRVLSYHAQLEAEIGAKVAEIQGDLLIAREFQEALMPHEYPRVPDRPAPGVLGLNFNHIYRPASTVGGDFFNVLKLSENRAGIFIADVMGHGARSALVTAIVATLLHDLAPKSATPADFMTVLNQHFHHLIQHSKQVVFVTAFYLVIDTAEQKAYFASAGHPSPLLVQRDRKKVRPLIHPMQNDTALGLLEESTYTCFSCPVSPHDLFLLFTDGLFEALNPKGEEFGLQNLIQVINRNLDFSAGEISHRILDTVNRFSGFAAQADDICLVSVEAVAAGEFRPRSSDDKT